jgi:hypothetical protein
MTTNPKTLAAVTKETTRTARLATIKTTLHELANIEASLRSEARLKFQLGLDPTILLHRAAFISEAARLIQEHAQPQD